MSYRSMLLLLPILTCFTLKAQDWKTIYTFNQAQTIQDVHVIDNETIYAASALYNGTDLNIKKSTDNGMFWKEEACGYTQMSLRGIDSPDGEDVFMIGNSGVLVHNNGTNVWTPIDLRTSEHLRSIYFLNSEIGYIGSDYGVLYQTVDGGKTWVDIQANTANASSVSNIHFIDENKGFIAGFNYMQVTEDGGANWEFVNQFAPQPGVLFQIQEIQFLDAETGYICGDVGLMYRTDDGGKTWVEQSTGTTESLQDMEFINKRVGFACGFEGTIIYTNDGGMNWQQMSADNNEHFRAIDFNDDRGFISTQRGSILAFDGLDEIVSTQNQPAVSLSIAPNPVKHVLRIDTDHVISDIQIFDVYGRLVDEVNDVPYKNEFDVRGLSSGTYVMHVVATDKTTITRVFAKQ